MYVHVNGRCQNFPCFSKVVALHKRVFKTNVPLNGKTEIGMGVDDAL